MKKRENNQPCFCGSGKIFSDCCGDLIDGSAIAQTAEQLMRSRYSAYCVGNESYLLKTWHPGTRPTSLELGKTPLKWVGLEVINVTGIVDDQATVEFVARFKQNGRAGKMHETSLFRRDKNQWFYVDAEESR